MSVEESENEALDERRPGAGKRLVVWLLVGLLGAAAVAEVVAILVDRTGLGDLEQRRQVENREFLKLVHDVELPEGYDIVRERLEGQIPFQPHVIQRVHIQMEGGGWFSALGESLREQGFLVEEYLGCTLQARKRRIDAFVQFQNVSGRRVGEVDTCSKEIGDRAVADFIWSFTDGEISG